MKYAKFITMLSALIFSTNAGAYSIPAVYVAIDAGLFQAGYDAAYRDQTDLIPQNISSTVIQHGYTEGLAIGISQLFHKQYLLGAEFSGHLESHNARYESGAASAAFSDNTQINRHLDLVLVPGIMLSPTIATYVKLGVSYASVHDNLLSPAGFIPTYGNYNSNQNKFGFAGGLGIKKYVTDHVAVFAEGNYHDYGVVTFANFQNFTASYTHTARVYSYGAVLGAAYQF